MLRQAPPRETHGTAKGAVHARREIERGGGSEISLGSAAAAAAARTRITKRPDVAQEEDNALSPPRVSEAGKIIAARAQRKDPAAAHRRRLGTRLHCSLINPPAEEITAGVGGAEDYRTQRSSARRKLPAATPKGQLTGPIRGSSRVDATGAPKLRRRRSKRNSCRRA